MVRYLGCSSYQMDRYFLHTSVFAFLTNKIRPPELYKGFRLMELAGICKAMIYSV